MLPQFLRKLMPVSTLTFVGVTVVACILLFAGAFLPSSMDEIISKILVGLCILWGVSFIVMMASILTPPLVRSVENTALRRLGQTGVATVQDFRTMIERGRYGHTRLLGVRIKLNVRTPEGETFEAIAEDSGDDWQDGDSELKIGQEVPVKYDPLTKEVVLMLPKHKPTKEPEAKEPDW